MGLLRHLLDARYLYAMNEQAPGVWSRGHVRYAAAIAIGMALVLWWHRHRARRGLGLAAPRFSLAALAASLLLHMCQLYFTSLASARIWYLSAALLAFGPFLYCIAVEYDRHVALVRALSKLARAQKRAGAGLSLREVIGWTVVHALGLTIVVTRHPEPGTWAIATALGALAWVSSSRWLGGRHLMGSRRPYRQRFYRVEILAPLLITYLGITLQWLVGDVIGVDTAPYAAFPYPDLWSPWFDGWTIVSMGIAGVAVTSWRATASNLGIGHRGIRYAGVALLVGAMVWYATTTARHISHGATGSDPYCYLQMAIDLAEHGTPLHTFSLAGIARDVGLPIWPTLHIGYRPLLYGTSAPTVWPIGWPLLLAALYRLGGEALAMWGAPLCNMLTAILACLLTREVGPDTNPSRSWLVGGLAAALLLTSQEVVLRALVPMADAAAQMWSVFALWALARAHRRDSLGWSAVAGACYAMAYTVRHPQLFLGCAAVALWWSTSSPRRRRLQHLAIYAGAAILAAWPDITYRTLIFGSPLATESPEWFLISWRNLPPTLWHLLQNGLLRRAEFGALWPFVFYGFWRWSRSRESRHWALMLGSSLTAIVAFSLCYRALRLRDLIAVYPWLALAASHGVVATWERCRRQMPQRALPALVLTIILLTLCSRTTHTLGFPQRPTLWTFGHVSAQARQEYDRLTTLVPPHAIVGTGLGSGAITLYAERDTVRPSAWTDDEFERFADAAGRPLYVLEDGTDMALWIEDAPDTWVFEPIATLALPTFARGGERLERDATLYSLEIDR